MLPRARPVGGKGEKGVRRAAECFKMRLRKLKGAGRCVTNAVRFLFFVRAGLQLRYLSDD